MSIAKQAAVNGVNLEAAALEKARALALAIGESPSFKAFEAAQEALMADREVNRRLQAYQARAQELQAARAWGGADPLAEEALEAEWQRLSFLPEVRRSLRAQEELVSLFREVTALISEAIGLDYGAACSPAGGCC